MDKEELKENMDGNTTEETELNNQTAENDDVNQESEAKNLASEKKEEEKLTPEEELEALKDKLARTCLLYTSPSPRDATLSRMPSSA